jgi:6-phosphogluconolactonase
MSRATVQTISQPRQGRILHRLGMLAIAPILLFAACSSGGDNGGGSPPATNNTPPPGTTANQFGYVIDAVSAEIRALTVDGTTGALAVVNGSVPIFTGSFPHDVQVDRQGRYVYVSNHDSSFVSGWLVNQDGSLNPINPATTGSPVTNLTGSDPTENQPHASVMDTNGQFLYVVAGVGPGLSTLKAYQIQTTAGATQGTLTAMAGQSFAVGVHGHRVRMSPNGQFLYVASEDSGEVYAFSRNTSTGALTPSATPKVTGLPGATDVQVDPTNKFLFASYTNAVEVMTIGADGSPTRITPVSTFSTNNNGQGSGPHSLVISPSGQSLYTANINAHTLSVFKVDPATGVLTELLPNPQTGSDPNYVYIHPNGGILYTADTVADQISKFIINGDGTLTASDKFGIAIVGDGPNGISITNK